MIDELHDYLRGHGWVRTIELGRLGADRRPRKLYRWQRPETTGMSASSDERNALVGALQQQLVSEGDVVALRLLLERFLTVNGWSYRRDYGHICVDHDFDREIHIWERPDPLAELDPNDAELAELCQLDLAEPHAFFDLLVRLQTTQRRAGCAARTYFPVSALGSAVGIELQRQGFGANIYD
jgi:hypothetical protein